VPAIKQKGISNYADLLSLAGAVAGAPFQGGWGADWVLKKLIDHRVADKKRKNSKLVIYSVIEIISN
jgi:hypothetical protein